MKRFGFSLFVFLLSCAASNASVTYTFADNQAWEQSADPFSVITGTLGFSVTLPDFITDPFMDIFPDQISNCLIPVSSWNVTCGVAILDQTATGVYVDMGTSAGGALSDDVFFAGATLTQFGSYSFGNASLVITDPPDPPASIPEPATWGLLCLGLGLFSWSRTVRRG